MANNNHWVGHQGGDHSLNGKGICCVSCIFFAHLDFAVWGSGEWDFTTKSSYTTGAVCFALMGFQNGWQLRVLQKRPKP
jgi:hypothetical protein